MKKNLTILSVYRTSLNCKSWYIRATVAYCPGTVHEGPNSMGGDSTNYAPLSVYSKISSLLQSSVIGNLHILFELVNIVEL